MAIAPSPAVSQDLPVLRIFGRWSACRCLLVVASGITATLPSCRVPDPPPITETWEDGFERDAIGPEYVPTQASYRIENGVLRAQEAYNHPLWLRKKLPPEARIEVDVWSDSSDGDIKIEIYGDGRSYAENKGQYTSSGYVLVMGGWKNTRSVLARGNEHGADRATRTSPRVERGRRYHWVIERTQDKLRWFVDDPSTVFLELDDPDPLTGSGHAYLGFNNWEAPVGFDNLRIVPL